MVAVNDIGAYMTVDVILRQIIKEQRLPKLDVATGTMRIALAALAGEWHGAERLPTYLMPHVLAFLSKAKSDRIWGLWEVD